MTASALTIAIERKNWTLAALCLLLGVAEVAARLPPETLDHLLDLLETDLDTPLPRAGLSSSEAKGAGEGGHRSARGRR